MTHVEKKRYSFRQLRRLLPESARNIAATLLIGLVGSALWDVITWPGMTKLTRWLLTILTFGSNSIRDSAYSMAALDPYPVTGVIILIVFSTAIPGAWLGVASARSLIRRRDRHVETVEKQLNETETDEAKAEVTDHLDRMRGEHRKTLLFVDVILSVLVLSGIVSVWTINQAVLIRRVAIADMAICAPFLSDQQEEVLFAQFAKVQSRQDYLNFERAMADIAKTHGVSLIDSSLW